MTYADALTRERDWLRADLSALDLPPLLAVIGDGTGPFGVIEAYPRRTGQQAHQLFVCRDPYTERLVDAQGRWREGMHGIALMILWQKRTGSELAHVDQEALDDAVDRVLDRVRGRSGDHSHGGRFDLRVATGEAGIRVEYPDPRTLDSVADAPFAAGDAYVVLVRYVAVESVGA